MTRDGRNTNVVVVAHCILNASTRAHGTSVWGGALQPLTAELLADEVGIVQLPCPEISCFGMARPLATREDYDTPEFREACRRILQPSVDTLVGLSADGVSVAAVYGVGGSPSCAAIETSERSASDAGQAAASRRVSGSGIYMQEFARMLAEAGIATTFLDAPRP